MCGIAGVHRLTDRPFADIDRFAAELLAGIESRGRDATGFVAFNDVGDTQMQKASCSAFYFNQHRGTIRPETRTLLLHTRLATQGKPAFPENNHPVEAGGIYCVHNGHVSNDAELFKASGRTRVGQVDSEVIPAVVASGGWPNALKSLQELDGDFAVALASPKHPKELVLARGNFSPLVYVQTDHLLVWASTAEAIRNAWKVLGSPPANGRFRHMLEGDALVINGGEVTRATFEPKARPLPSWAITKKTPKVYVPKTSYASREIVTRYEWDDKECDLVAVTATVEDEDGDQEDGWDIVKCDDCGDWIELDDLREVEMFGVTNLLCRACYEWAKVALGGFQGG